MEDGGAVDGAPLLLLLRLQSAGLIKVRHDKRRAEVLPKQTGRSAGLNACAGGRARVAPRIVFVRIICQKAAMLMS